MHAWIGGSGDDGDKVPIYDPSVPSFFFSLFRTRARAAQVTAFFPFLFLVRRSLGWRPFVQKKKKRLATRHRPGT
jgi:hypothetical protein